MLGLIEAPTQITFGRHDMVTSTRFAGPLTEAIKGTELVVFEDCAHAPIYENVAEFNARTMDFLARNSNPFRFTWRCDLFTAPGNGNGSRPLAPSRGHPPGRKLTVYTSSSRDSDDMRGSGRHRTGRHIPPVNP